MRTSRSVEMWFGRLLCGVLFTGALLVGCEQKQGPATVRLVDLFGSVPASNANDESPASPARTEWRFDGSDATTDGKTAPTRGWQAGSGVAGLRLRDGRLAGRSTSAFPIVHVERTDGSDSPDPLHAVEIRMRASAGANLSITFRESERLDVGAVIERAQIFRWHIATPLDAGNEMRTYVLRPAFYPKPNSEIRHVLIRPTDAVDATFEIESVRLIFRREHLASVPGGVGWHGLSQVFKETIVTRSPETIRIPVKLPVRPWLDLSMGTIDEGAVTFRVGVGAADGSPAQPESVVFERTLTTPHRWQSARVDLSELAGQDVVLSLSLVAERHGRLGFWGSPVVRSSGASPVGGSAGITPRGVILILADTLRRDHLSSYGYRRETAPVLAKLARDGVIFDDCQAQGTWTKVSAPSIFTSLYPTTNNVRELFDSLPRSATTLAEVFRRGGFATLALSSSTLIGSFTNLQQGFEELHEEMSLSEDDRGKSAREYVDRLLPWLETHQDVPFFVVLHIFDPHDPYEPRSPYDVLWADPKRLKEFDRQSDEVEEAIADPPMKLREMPTRAELIKALVNPDKHMAYTKDWYDGSIRGMDVELGRLFERLDSLGLGDDTLVVFTSDHGEEFLDHGATWHGHTVYGELTNVPLVFWWPAALAAGTTVEATTESIDIMPTVLELSGLARPEGLQGRSLISFMKPSRASDVDDPGRRTEVGRSAVSEKPFSADTSGPGNRELESFAFIRDGWKLIHNRKRPAGVPEYELYDHRNDLLDQKNLAAERSGLVRELAEALESWHGQALAARLEPDAELRPNVNSDELERLRSLGYLK